MVRHLTFFLTNIYLVNGNTQLMSDLTDNQFYSSAERICIRLNNAGKWDCGRLTADADFDKKSIFSDEAHFEKKFEKIFSSFFKAFSKKKVFGRPVVLMALTY